MKLQKPKQLTTIGTAVSLALLLAVGTVNAAKPDGTGKPGGGNSPNQGIESYGASIGVSNVCEVSGNNLLVETTITDKSSGDTKPFFVSIGILPFQKVRSEPNSPLWSVVPAVVDLDKLNKYGADPVTRQYAPFTTPINLCEAGLTSDATSVNAVIKVKVFNSNKTDFNSKCTAKYDQGLKIGNLGISC
jgi:hypothetical protein